MQRHGGLRIEVARARKRRRARDMTTGAKGQAMPKAGSSQRTPAAAAGHVRRRDQVLELACRPRASGSRARSPPGCRARCAVGRQLDARASASVRRRARRAGRRPRRRPRRAGSAPAWPPRAAAPGSAGRAASRAARCSETLVWATSSGEAGRANASAAVGAGEEAALVGARLGLDLDDARDGRLARRSRQHLQLAAPARRSGRPTRATSAICADDLVAAGSRAGSARSPAGRAHVLRARGSGMRDARQEAALLVRAAVDDVRRCRRP